MKWLALLCLLAPSFARADVLMLNINNNPKEVEAARAAAKKSGRDFYVFPDLNRDQVRTLAKLEAARKKARDKTYEACDGKDPVKCDEATIAQKKANDQWNAYSQGVSLDKDAIRKFLEARERSGKPITTLVVSGHDGTGHFGGLLGGESGISDEELAGLFKDLPQTSASLRSIHLWGCYTTSPGSLMLDWKKYFPNVALFSGYEGRAPLGDKPAGWQYLKGVIEREPALLHINDSTKLKKALRQIPGALMVNAAVNVCDEYASIKDNFNLREMASRCESYKPAIQAGSPEYDCYYKASEDRCADVPKDTERGPIRLFYELLHKASACQEMMADPIFRSYTRDDAIRLVFDQEVRKNFAHNYQSQLLEMDQILQNLGAPENLRFAKLDTISRKELLNRIQKLDAFLTEQAPDPVSKDPVSLQFGKREAELYVAGVFQRGLTSVTMQLGRCVPFNWVEPDQSEESECLAKKDIGLSAAAEALRKAPLLKQNTVLMMQQKLDRKMAQDPELKPTELTAKAKNNLYGAYIQRLYAYRKGDVSPLGQKAIEKQISWAQTVLDVARTGRQNPEQDPKALRVGLETRAAELNERKSVIETNKRKLQERMASATDEKEKKSVAEEMKRYDDYLQAANTSLRGLRLLSGTVLAGGEEIPSPEKLAAINKVAREVAAASRAQEKWMLEQNIKYMESMLERFRNRISAVNRQLYVDRRNEYVRALKRFEDNSPQTLEKEGINDLLTPDFAQTY